MNDECQLHHVEEVEVVAMAFVEQPLELRPFGWDDGIESQGEDYIVRLASY